MVFLKEYQNLAESIMNDHQKNLNHLLERLESLMEKQWQLQQELFQLKGEIQSQRDTNLKDASLEAVDTSIKDENQPDIVEKIEREFVADREEAQAAFGVHHEKAFSETSPSVRANPQPVANIAATNSSKKSNLEKFIGENLINKIGIVIIVIGVGIGAKYSIENQLISPLTRIIIGYLFGLGFIGAAIWLKEKYDNFSAVLLSGGMATLYLITFAAYSFYDLFPQSIAFGMMVIFTAFTVVSALHYNRQVIAHIGLVGAYAVPFLLSDGSGKVGILFTYMTIINIGILVIAIKKYWKSLYYAAFSFTWIIFMSWYFSRYITDEHFGMTVAFASIFFIIFYFTFLSYKLISREQFGLGDVVLLILNSFIFYGLGYSILSVHETGEQLLGLFTLVNAIIHFGVTYWIYKKQQADKNLFYLLAGLVLVFITIAVPVQLDGSWVTLLWAGQAALLFWIGRRNQVPLYEILSYPMIILAFISILQDWSWENYDSANPVAHINVVFNVQFLTAMLFLVAISFIQYMNVKSQYISSWKIREFLIRLFNFIIPGIILIVSYFAFRLEIEMYWDQQFIASAVEVTTESDYTYTTYDYNLDNIKTIWIVNYSLIFLICLVWANILKLENKILDVVIFGLNVLATIVFLSISLLMFSELRDNYLSQYMAEYYFRNSAHLPLRYFSIAIFMAFLYSFYRLMKRDHVNMRLKTFFNYILHIAILWVASSELINILDLSGSANSYKLGLSILWGVYSLFMITLGIWKKKQQLRMAAIGLFGVTLLKLFFYDISHLDTIAKTVVFVSLGLLLLIISFLYNKYKLLITDEI